MADEDIKTLAVKLALEDSTFKQGMDNLKKQLSVADSEFAATGGKVKGFGSTLDGVKANAQALGDKIKTTNEIVSQYKVKIEETQAALQKQSETMMKNKAAMEQANAEYQKNLEELGKNDEATVKSKAALDEQTSAYKRSEAQVRNSEKSLNGYTIQMNEATGKLKAMQAELASSNGFAIVSKNLEDAGAKVESIGKKISSAGQSWTWGVSLPIAAAGVACVKMASDFETSSAKVSTISDKTVMSMDKMKQGALDLSTATHDDINDINQSLYQAMSAGIKTGDSLKFVGDAVKLAKGGFTDTTTAVNTLTSVLNAYHKPAADAASISDQLIKTQDLGKTTVGELGQSLGQVIPIAASLNVSTQDLFTSIAELTKNGMPADEAITAIKGALSGVLKPSKDASKAAQQLGIDFSAAHLQNVGFADFINEIAAATDGNAQKMSDLFKNVRALNGMTVLAGKGNQDFNQTLKDMSGATGATNDAFEKMESTGAAKLEAAINTLKNDGIKAGEDLMPAVAGIANKVVGLADSFAKASPQMQQTVLKIAEITAVTGPAIWALGGVTQAVGGLTSGIGSAIGGIGNFIKGISGVELAAGEAAPTAMRLGSAIADFGVGGTVGLAIAGIGLLVTGILAFSAATSKVKGPADDLINTINSEAKSWQDLKAQEDNQMSSDLAEINRTQSLWDWLQKNVDANGKLTGSKQVAASIVDQINKTTGKQELQLVGDTVQGYQNEKKAIDDAIASKRAQIILQDKESGYKDALKNYQKAENEQAQLGIQISQQAIKVEQEKQKVTETGSAAWAYSYNQDKEILDGMQGAYSKNEGRLKEYYSTISDYESASAAEQEGNFKKTESILSQNTLAYTKAGGATKQELQNQVQVYATEAQQMQQRYSEGVKGVTKEMVDEAEKQAQNAKVELQKFGIESTQGMVNGIDSQTTNIQAAGKRTAQAYLSGLKSLDWSTFLKSTDPYAGDIAIHKSSLGHNASGTNDWRGGFTWVGEQGPELMNLPQGTQILSNSESMKMASGATLPNMLKSSGADAWGADMMQLFAKGITANQAIVIASVSKVASGVHDYLGFSKPSKGALSNADVYMLDFMQLLSDTIDKNSDKPATAAKKVANLVSDEVSKIKTNTTASVKDLNSQITVLENQRTQALRSNSTVRVAVESEYSAKIKAIRNEISSLESGSKGKGKSKNGNSARIKELEGQISELEAAEKQAVNNISTTGKQAISDEYKAKIQAIKDKISAVKDGATKEIAEIQRVGKADKEQLDQEIENRKTFVSNVNSLVDEVKDALSKEYQDEESKQETAINNELSGLETWKTAQEDAINTVYKQREDAADAAATAEENAIQAQLDALDAATQASDRAATQKGYTDKISDLQSQITYSHDDYNTAQLQKQLAQEQTDYQAELDNEATDDKKAALQTQLDAVKSNLDAQKQALEDEKAAQINSIEAVYTAQQSALNNQLTAVKNTYAQETTDANLEAQAEQMIMQNNQDAIIKLLNSYSDTYKLTGQTLGDKMAEGFQPAIDKITTEIANINAAISSARSSAMAAQAAIPAVSPNTAGAGAAPASSGVTNNNINTTINSPTKLSPSDQVRAVGRIVQKILFQQI